MNIENLLESLNFFIIGLLELSVLFLVISFFVEIMNKKISPLKIQKLLSSKKNGYFSAAMLGALTPFCSCSTIPLTIGLIKAKAGFGPIMTFLFTSPILNPIIISVFYISFGLEITLVYTLIAFSVSLLAGYILEKIGFEKYVIKEEQISTCTLKDNSCSTPSFKASSFTTQETACCTTESPKEKEKTPYKELLTKTYKQFLSFLPYIAIGMGIGAFVHGFVPKEFITQYAGSDNIFAVPVSALIGIPMYIRAETMVGLAPELIEKGLNLGSILALTIAGAGASLPEMILLKKIFKTPIVLFFLVTVFSMAIGCGFLINMYFV